jgi:N-acetylglucosaminyldiphosphoundecaprenol N-acetyl-beta-D-mannosaminyltransferase
MDEAVAAINDDAESGVGRVYVLVNAHSATLAMNSDYRTVLVSQDSVFLADGASVTLGALFCGQNSVSRVPGPDLMDGWARSGAGTGQAAYLLGGAPGVAEQVARQMTIRHPGLVIAGTHTPSFNEWTDLESREMLRAIRDSGATVVWLGVSAPKQEIWANKWVHEIRLPLVCVGAAFDFHAGVKPRAPQWMRALGMEWLFRLVSEPRRLWKRYLIGNAVFLRDLVWYRGRRPEWATAEPVQSQHSETD